MPLLHIANTNFEWELAQNQPVSLIQAIEHHPISLQLQFLPLLYADPLDGIAVTALPGPEFTCTHRLHLLSDTSFPYEHIESWGASPSTAAWAATQHIACRVPSKEIARKVNSKAFSFTHSPKLPGSALLHSGREVHEWCATVEGPKVLKTCFGFSGRGHLLLPCPPETLKRFIEKEFQQCHPIIGEPWVVRTLDFSTQWIIHPNQQITYLGETICVNSPRGQYLETQVGGALQLPEHFLEKHKEIAFPILQKMATEGYFGNVGIDAMIYNHDRLQPIVEINARKTMGYVALKLQQTRFPKQTISLSYQSASQLANLLPHSVAKQDGSLVKFAKQLVINTHSR